LEGFFIKKALQAVIADTTLDQEDRDDAQAELDLRIAEETKIESDKLAAAEERETKR
jgi:hypothetical protein